MAKENVNEEIRAAIERVHEKDSNDYQTLMRQVERAHRNMKVELNLPQLMVAYAGEKMFKNDSGHLQGIEVDCEWGRGTGKTTIRGFRWRKTLEQLPRSTGLFIGPNYQFILTRIVPSLVQGLEMFGLYENLHYFIGRRPPTKWRKYWGTAYQPPDNYNRYITFFNGMGVHLISHDVKGDGRGLNTDWIDGDEAALLDVSALQENTDPTLRGTNTGEFYGKPYFGSKFYTSSTPLTEDGQWFVGREETARLHPNKVKFISATCAHNLHNLRPGYLEDAEMNAYSEWKFLAEYHNQRPNFARNGFYSLLSPDIHYYSNTHSDYSFYEDRQAGRNSVDCRTDADLVRGLPLIAGMDWGAAINCMVVCQHLQSLKELRAIKDFYALSENQEIQDDLLDAFCNYYQYHDNKTIYLWYDNTGNNKTGNTRRTRAEQARDLLQRRGWTVRLMTVGGSNPLHDEKHLVWECVLKEDIPWLPAFRINKWNCQDTATSMRFARTKPGRNGEIKKDKRSERSKKIPRQHATDLSDAIDQVVFGMFRSQVKRRPSSISGLRIVSH